MGEFLLWPQVIAHTSVKQYYTESSRETLQNFRILCSSENNSVSLRFLYSYINVVYGLKPLAIEGSFEHHLREIKFRF